MNETFIRIKSDFDLYCWKVTDTVLITRRQNDKAFLLKVVNGTHLLEGEADEIRRVALAIRGDTDFPYVGDDEE